MIQISELESLSFISTKLWLPFDNKSRNKGNFIFVLNTTQQSIADLINDKEDRISNNGTIYKAYYYDYTILPKCIQSNKVVNSGLTIAKAKSQRLENYATFDSLCDVAITPVQLSTLSGKNFIYDLNPVTDLYSKQSKLKKIFLVEQLKTYFATIHSVVSTVSTPITDYIGGCIFVNLDDYSKYDKNVHILHNIFLLLKRSDRVISEFSNYNMKILFYNKKGSFIFDMSKDLIKSNISKLKNLTKRMGVDKISSDVDNTEKEKMAEMISTKAVKKYMTGEDDDEFKGIIPDDIQDALDCEDETEDETVDPDDEVVSAVKSKLEDDSEIDDALDASDKLDEVFDDDDIKRKYNDAMTKKSTNTKSEASLKRDAMLREQQKDLVVHGKTIAEITKDKSITPIKHHRVDIESVTNENIKDMKFPELDKTYMETTYQKDIVNMIMSMTDASVPVNIIDIKTEDTSDSLTMKETYTITIEDTNRKRHTLKFDLPLLIDDKYMYVNGNKKTMAAQFYPYPLVKIGKDSIQIVTNYQKITVTRTGSRFNKNSEKLKKLLSDPSIPITVKNGENTLVNEAYLTCLEYDEIARLYSEISVGNAKFIFNARKLHDLFEGREQSKLDKILVGYHTSGSKKIPIYYDTSDPEHVDLVSLIISFASSSVQDKFNHMSSGKKYIYNAATVMKKNIPVVVLLGFFEGLDTVLRKFNHPSVKFFAKQDNPNYQYIKFKDGYLGYPMSDMEACLLFNGFAQVPTNAYTLADMNERDTYLDILDYLYGTTHVAGALINFYDFMIDPITYEILQTLDYPTDFVSLMIFASNLLADNDFLGETNLTQYRLRRNEVISVILYKNIVRAYSRYRQTANNPNPTKISMDQGAVIKELMALPTVEDYSTLSPMVEMHKDGIASMKGANGMNKDRSYSLDKRGYDDTMLGIVGISTSPDYNCGKIRQLAAEPRIKNVRGFLELNDLEKDGTSKLTDANIITPVEYLTPMTTTNDASERTAMATKQTCHVIPVEHNCPVLVTAGMDQMAHYRTGNDFSVVAKEDGKVIEYDEEAELIVIEYKDKTTQAIDLSSHVVKNGAGGFYLSNKLQPKIKKGQTFKKDDILAYDPKYYKDQGVIGNRLTTGSLMKVAVISNFSTYEDSAFVTKYMSEQMATNITMQKHLILGANANVDYIVQPGQEINAGDDLIRYESSYDEPELNRLLASVRDDMKEEIINLGRSALHSPYTGTIEDVIIYSGVDIDEMSPSLQKVFKNYQKRIKAKHKILDKYSENKNSVYRMGVLVDKPIGRVEPDQFGKIKGYNVGKGLLIEFYITYHDELSDGDKLAASTANKNTIGYVVPRGLEPYSESRPYEEISAPVAPSAVLQRGTPSVIITGCAYKVLVELKRFGYKLLTGQDYDEVLKQKQPWMDIDEPVSTKESTVLELANDSEILILETMFDLQRGDNGYTSEKCYLPGDVIVPLHSFKDWTPFLENFGTGNSNAYIDEESSIIKATRMITPGSPIILE